MATTQSNITTYFSRHHYYFNQLALTALAGRPSTLSHLITYLFSPPSVYITNFHFTKTISTERPIGHHLTNMLRLSSPTDLKAQMFMRQTNTLSRLFWILTDSSCLKEITTAQIILTNPCISTSLSIIITIFVNKTDQIHKSLLLTII